MVYIEVLALGGSVLNNLSINVLFSLTLFTVTLPAVGASGAHPSDLREVSGLKFPNSPDEGANPVSVSVLAFQSEQTPLGGFSEMVPFALRAPDQEEAGSCLYMSLTGIAEWWLARLNPRALRTPDGPIDLSERYLMNIAGVNEDSNGIANWKTDSVYLFNYRGGTLRNVDYRFAKGWYSKDAGGTIHKSYAGAPGAHYDAFYSWLDERSSAAQAPFVKLPRFRREVLFADPESNQWNTGVMPFDIVDRIKAALVEKKAPVQVIYNHFGYWHATVILGFNDEQDNLDCKFVRRFIDYMGKQAVELRQQAAREKDPAERAMLLRRAEKSEWALNNTKRGWDRGGGCHPKGTFYVRDSIYGDKDGGPIYDYDFSQKGEEAPYTKSTVLLEYDWVRYMANHAVQILVE